MTRLGRFFALSAGFAPLRDSFFVLAGKLDPGSSPGWRMGWEGWTSLES